MDFVGYAEGSAALVNADLDDVGALRRHLAAAERDGLAERCVGRDVTVLRRFQRQLHGVFEAAEAGSVGDVVDGLNALMERHPVTPRISDHDPGDLHLHVASEGAGVADLLIGESLLGLSTLVCALGPLRLGVCDAAPCSLVYVDTSPNQSRRYCSERCSSRTNVAAYRARRRSAAGAPA